MYCFVHGYCPFETDEAHPIELYHKILNDKISINDKLSPELTNLLTRMLDRNPKERITISKIKVHSWTTSNNREPMMSTEDNCMDEEVTELDVENGLQPVRNFVTKVSALLYPAYNGIR